MLQAYVDHVAERAALGIPPLPLSAKQTSDLIELLKRSVPLPAIYSTQRQVAAALGVATLGTVLVSRVNSAAAGVRDPAGLAHAALSGYRVAFFVGTVLVALAALAMRLEGAAGTVGVACVVALATFELADGPALLLARTR